LESLLIVGEKRKKIREEEFELKVLNSKKVTLVEFWAEWNGTCHIIAPMLDDLASFFKGKVEFFKVDVESCKELMEQYGIYKIPTLLLFKNGKMVNFFIDVVSKRELKKKIKSELRGGNILSSLLVW